MSFAAKTRVAKLAIDLVKSLTTRKSEGGLCVSGRVYSGSREEIQERVGLTQHMCIFAFNHVSMIVNLMMMIQQ